MLVDVVAACKLHDDARAGSAAPARHALLDKIAALEPLCAWATMPKTARPPRRALAFPGRVSPRPRRLRGAGYV